jgi:calcium-dependent protein kinase
VLLKQYDQKCDIWSCGVILYILLCGYPPFNGKNEFEIFSKIIKGEFVFPEEEWADIRSEAKDRVRRMLTYDPEKRPEAIELLSDPWFSKCHFAIKQEALNPKTLENLKSFHSNSLFKRAILLHFVRYYELTDEKNHLLESFKAIDKDHDGQLTREELMEEYAKTEDVDDPESTVNHILSNLDFDNNNAINFTEFLVANLDYKKSLTLNELGTIFKEIDSNQDGFLSVKELEEFFANGLPDSQEVSQLILSELDRNHDGKVSFQEFESAMKNCI